MSNTFSLIHLSLLSIIFLALLFVIGHYIVRRLIIQFIGWICSYYHPKRIFFVWKKSAFPYYSITGLLAREGIIIEIISTYLTGLIIIILLLSIKYGKNSFSVLHEIFNYFILGDNKLLTSNLLLTKEEIAILDNNSFKSNCDEIFDLTKENKSKTKSTLIVLFVSAAIIIISYFIYKSL